jgi:hypothetical protein
MHDNVPGLIFVVGVIGVLISLCLYLIAGELQKANHLKKIELKHRGIPEKEIEGK